MAGKNQFEDPYERLANAIILSAVADYRAALKKVKRNPKSKAAIDEALQIEKFFQKFVVSTADFGCWRILNP